MDVLLSLKVFSLYFYLFLDFFIFIKPADIRGDPNPIGNGDLRRGWGWGAGGMSPPPWVPIAIPNYKCQNYINI